MHPTIFRRGNPIRENYSQPQQQPQQAPVTRAATQAEFRGACVPQQSSVVKVPTVKYVKHVKPVVYETVTQEVSYIDVPVQYSYETKEYQQGLQSDCIPQQQQQAPQARQGGGKK
eukprot:Pgem_evm3s6026